MFTFIIGDGYIGRIESWLHLSSKYVPSPYYSHSHRKYYTHSGMFPIDIIITYPSVCIWSSSTNQTLYVYISIYIYVCIYIYLHINIICVDQIDGKVWSIEEQPLPPRVTEWYGLDNQSPLLRNELAVQHVVPPRKLLCLTNNGIQVVVKLRPLDQLYHLLALSSSTGGRESEDLFVSSSPFSSSSSPSSSSSSSSSIWWMTADLGVLLSVSISLSPMHIRDSLNCMEEINFVRCV